MLTASLPCQEQQARPLALGPVYTADQLVPWNSQPRMPGGKTPKGIRSGQDSGVLIEWQAERGREIRENGAASQQGYERSAQALRPAGPETPG